MCMRVPFILALVAVGAACSEVPTDLGGAAEVAREEQALSLERLEAELLSAAGLRARPAAPGVAAARAGSFASDGPALAPLSGPVTYGFGVPSPAEKVFVSTNGAAGNCVDTDNGNYRFLLPITDGILNDLDTLFAYGGAASVNGETRHNLTGDGVTGYAELHRLRLITPGSVLLLGATMLSDTANAPGSPPPDTIAVSLPVTSAHRSLMNIGDTLELEYFGRGKGVLPSTLLNPLCGTVSSANVEWEGLPRNAARATLDLDP